MVTAAKVISKLSDGHKYKISVLQYDNYEEAEGESILSAYQEATVAVCPGLTPIYEAGDMVFVCIEDNRLDSPVIMGALSTSTLKSLSDARFNSLEVTGDTVLSKDTTIGEVEPKNIEHLKGTRDFIQKQFDDIMSVQMELQKSMTEIMGPVFKKE